MDQVARQGDRQIPSAQLPGEHGGPLAPQALANPKAFAGRRASADSFRMLTAKLRRPPLAPLVVAPAADAGSENVPAAAPPAPDPRQSLQPEIEVPPQPVRRERFDMGWTSQAISPASPPRRRAADRTDRSLDEFSDLPPEFLGDRRRPEAPAGTLQEPGEGTPAPVAAATPAQERPEQNKFWELTTTQAPTAPAPANDASSLEPPSVVEIAPPADSSAAAAVVPPEFAAHGGPLQEPGVAGEAPPVDDIQAADKAWALLEIISLSNDTTQPQERALAADALLNLLPRLPVRILMTIAERLSSMEAPPRLIANQLVRDHRPEIFGPLLEKSSGVSDQDLADVIAGGRTHSARMIARRRILSQALCSAVIATGDPSVILTLVRNPGAAISYESFIRLNAIAGEHTSLQAPLATRSDLPAPVAFELFWSLPVELRRYVLSRFLTDSKTTEKILQITKSVAGDSSVEEPPPSSFPSRERIDQFVALALSGDSAAAAKLLAELAGIQESNAARIIADRDGEPIAAALKAMGVPRGRFAEIIASLRDAPACALRPERKVEELQSLFDTLSFNKARVLLTYWDWAAAQSGPYEIHC